MNIDEVREHCYSILERFNLKDRFNFDIREIPITENGRLTRTLGRVKYTYVKSTNEIVEITGIEFSKSYLRRETDENVIAVIQHECAHVLVNIETGHCHGHDKMFKEACKRIGTKFDSASADCDLETTAKASKYVIKCSCCNKILDYRNRACDLTKRANCYTSKCCHAPCKCEQNW